MNADRLLEHYERIADAPDAIAQLRRFILDLAARGKLVPQNPGDEPASELLKRIAKEKARLVKAKEFRERPALPVVAEDDAPFGVPATWLWVRFSNIVDFSAGRTPSRNDPSFWNTGDHAWVSIADMVDGQVLLATKETVSERARDRVFGSEPEAPGTIIMSFKLTIGKIARLGVPAFHNEAIISIRPHLAELDGYLFKVLPQFARQGDTKGAIKGATLNRESISNILFPLPPLAEQHRIVAKIDELMALCDRLEAARGSREATRDKLTAASLARLNAPDPDTFQDDIRFALDALPALTTRFDQIKALRQTILNLAARGKLVPQDPKDEPASELLKRIARERTSPQKKKSRRNGEPEVSSIEAGEHLPGGWSWTTIGEIALSMRYGTSTKCEYAADGVPVLRIPNVSGGVISLDDIKLGPLSHKEILDLALRVGDLLMIRSNGSLDIVGRSAVVTAEADGMAFAGYLVRLRLSLANTNPEYVWLALNSTDVRNQIERPIRSAVGLKNVNLTEFGALTFPLPPLAEQHRIVAKVDALMALCERLEAALATADTTRARLLEALLHEALDPTAEAMEAAE
jgi:type I restriction enzyme, S subunit